jgi:hypothetical protein
MYIQKRTFVKCRERFFRNYSDSPVPTKACMPKLIKWQTIESVRDKTWHHRKTVVTDEKLENIWVQLQISPQKSQRLVSQKTGVSVVSTSEEIN